MGFQRSSSLTEDEEAQAARLEAGFPQNSSRTAPDSGLEPALLAPQQTPALLAGTGNRDVTTVDTFPQNCETTECGSACPPSLTGDPRGVHSAEAPVQRLPAPRCAPRAGERSFLAATATCDRVLVTFKTLGLVTALAFANVNI